jgi:hypothetical protein
MGELGGGDDLAPRTISGQIGRERANDASRPRRHHDHPMGEQQRFIDVMGHEQHRTGLELERREQPLLHAGSGDGVERGERLVEQQDVLLGHQGPQEGHSLAQAAGELCRCALLELGEPEALEEGPCAFAGLVSLHAPVLEGDRRVVDGRAPWKQQVSLRHERAPPQSLLGRHGLVDGHGAFVGLDESRDRGEQCGFAAPAWPDDAESLVSIDREVHAIEDDEFPEAMVDASQADRGRGSRSRWRGHAGFTHRHETTRGARHTGPPSTTCGI